MNTFAQQDLNRRMFDAQGPQIASEEAGPEPSLRHILTIYYTGHGIDSETAQKLVRRYIAAWEGWTA